MHQQSLSERDKKIIWHPFTQHGLESEFLPVVTGKGAWLELSDGAKVLDAISSWWVNLHGHAHPFIAKAIYQQAKQLEHVIFAGFTHEPAVQLAELLLAELQARGTQLSRCFYSDNGSTSVEVAMKMAYQYHKNLGVKSRTKFIALANSYHGDTLGAMALSARGSFHQHFTELLPPIDFAATDDLVSLTKLLESGPQTYAAIIVEPMVQAAGGMRIHSAEFLRGVAKLCKEFGVLLICDEVFTGFYRTGKCFAFEHAAIKPDLLCVAKGLTGGFLPLAATFATEEIFAAYHSTKMDLAFYHSHSFTANPLACAAALASWEVLHRKSTQAAIKRIATQTSQWITQLSQHPQVAQGRSLGTIGAIEIRNAPSYFSSFGYKVRSYAVKRGVLLRPLGSVLYTVPPYCTNEAEIDQIYTLMGTILNELETFTNERVIA